MVNCRHKKIWYSEATSEFHCSYCNMFMGEAVGRMAIALQAVGAGIWTDKTMNTKGLSGGSLTAELVEKALEHLEGEEQS